MRIRKISYPFFVVLAVIAMLASCTEEWDNHYNTKYSFKSDLTIYKYIESRSDLSRFRKMLNITGYDSILSRTQTFTVWAPNDSALKNIDMNDTALVRKIVLNHITRFSYPTSGIISKKMIMLNSKRILFTKTNQGYSFGTTPIKEPDLATKNGIVHVLDAYEPYINNIWEFITKTDGLDSLRAFLKSTTFKVLDINKSYQDKVFVDSIFKETNYVLDTLGVLNSEDSVYTAILPDNLAWKTAYEQIFPCFNMLPKDGGVKKQVLATRKTIINNSFFKGRYSLDNPKDSIYSTYAFYSTYLYAFTNPNRLFSGSQLFELSNGYGYVTSKIQSTPEESWKRPIIVESEHGSYYGNTYVNYSPSYYNSSLGTGFNLSNKNYSTFTDMSTSSGSRVYANFPIPNTLSTRYNIYCVVVPPSIVSPADLRANKLQFSLAYVNSAGVTVAFAVIDANHKVQTPTSTSVGIFTTKPGELDKLLVVSDFKFPYANIVDFHKDKFASDISVVLRVQNAATKSAVDQVKYTKDLRIDCIILEPVE